MNSAIMVIGDAMIDVKYDCQSIRLSPEAPVPVCLFDKAEYSLGGAANTAAQIAQNEYCLLTYIDTFDNTDKDSKLTAERLALMLQKAQVDKVVLTGYDDYIIPEKIRIWADQQVCRLDKELQPHQIHISEELREKWLQTIQTIIKKHDVRLVILSDYNKGTLDDDFIQNIADFCKSRNIITILDPKRPTYRNIKGLTIVTPNREEMEKTILEPYELSQDLNSTYLLYTRGADGMDLYQNGKLIKHENAHLVEVADACGAGDTVVAFLALSLAYNDFYITELNIMQAIRHANYAASRTVRHRGSYVLNKEEVQAVFGLPNTM
jgi:D-beta-D-heptose 7-phosphate kinase/D-beta-D-heptose 1-phosphate adenosyltransferase